METVPRHLRIGDNRHGDDDTMDKRALHRNVLRNRFINLSEIQSGFGITRLITLATVLSFCPDIACGGEDLMALAPDAAYYAAAAADGTSSQQLRTNTIKLSIPPPPSASAQRVKMVEIDPNLNTGAINFNSDDMSNSFIPAPPRESIPSLDETPSTQEAALVEHLLKSVTVPSSASAGTLSGGGGALRPPGSLSGAGSASLPESKAGRVGGAGVMDQDFIPGLITPEHLVTHLAPTAPGNKFASVPPVHGADDLSDLVPFLSPVAGVQSTQPTLIENIMANDIMTMASSSLSDFSHRGDQFVATLEPLVISDTPVVAAKPEAFSFATSDPVSQGAVSFHSQPPYSFQDSLQTDSIQSFAPVPVSMSSPSPIESLSFESHSSLMNSGVTSISVPPPSGIRLEPPTRTDNIEGGSSGSSGPLRLRIPPSDGGAGMGDGPMLGSIAGSQTSAAPVAALPPQQPLPSMGLQESSIYWPGGAGSSASMPASSSSSAFGGGGDMGVPSALSPGEFSPSGSRVRSERRESPSSSSSPSSPASASAGRSGPERQQPRQRVSGRGQQQQQQQRQGQGQARNAQRDRRRPEVMPDGRRADGMINMRGKNIIGPPDPKMFR